MTVRREKWCSGCKEAKPRNEFHRRSAAKDGLASRCKECSSEYQKRHYAKNRAKRKEQAAIWFAKNRDKRRAQQRAWYESNKARNYANSRAWVKDNREAYTELMRRRRALIRERIIGPVDLDALWTGTCGICAQSIDRDLRYPDPMSKSIDHIVPIARGGTHEQANLQWTHLTCNIRKGIKSPEEAIA